MDKLDDLIAAVEHLDDEAAVALVAEAFMEDPLGLGFVIWDAELAAGIADAEAKDDAA